MKLRYIALALKSDDYKIPNPLGSKYPYSILPIVSDFSFQTEYICDYIEKMIRKEKFGKENFNMITFRGRQKPDEKIKIEDHLKNLEIDVFFDEKKYRQLYPRSNNYPLKNGLIPLNSKNEFDDFLISMLIDGIEKAKNQTNIPHQFLINTILDFKSQGCKNEWIHKSLIIKDFGVKAILFCRLTTNYFSLTLILFKKNKKIFKKEILRELPSKICYSNEFDDIIYKKNKLIVTKKLQLQSESPLAEFNIAEILEAISEAPAKR